MLYFENTGVFTIPFRLRNILYDYHFIGFDSFMLFRNAVKLLDACAHTETAS